MPEVTEAAPVDANLEHRLARIPEFRHRVLRVIVNASRTPPQVVEVCIIKPSEISSEAT